MAKLFCGEGNMEKMITSIAKNVNFRSCFQSKVGVDSFERLQTKLDKYFTKKLLERPVHPSNLLTTSNSPYHMKSRSPLFPIKQLIKSALRGKWLTGDPRVGVFLCVHANILAKR